ncbi:putative transmembrane protein [Rhodopirellula islandica]|uniref:Transmembrane protein n=1 Tax=Rhodopirellula islandica TaxID=595434 RepID=A0A0J1EKF5_RHOIS|nr:hypothetical protein [Rhodopirellula islandica]KLU06019.1 putative transmembrane protein [Rhodopirellula islandica]
MIAPAHSRPPRRIEFDDALPESLGLDADGKTPSKLKFINQSVAKYPTASLVAAGVFGVALGWIVKRRPV